MNGWDHELGERELLGDLCPFCEDDDECFGACRIEEPDDPPMNVIDLVPQPGLL